MVRVDKVIDGKRSAEFRIIDATHSSPLTITLKPTRIATKKNAATLERVVQFHHKFFREMSALSRGEAPSDDVDDATLILLNKIAKGYGKTFKSLKIKNSGEFVTFDAKFRNTVNALLTNQIVSFGSLVGNLDALNVHGERSNMIWVYPSSGPERVACRVPARFKTFISESARKTVRVTGKKHYRTGSIHPHFIDVEDIEPAPTPGDDHISKLRGVFAEHGDNDGSGEFTNTARNEWD